MIGKLFSARRPSRPERPSFRPVLESLESREVPSCAQVSAAFDQLPAAVNNLEASLASRNVSGINTNLAIVTNDMFYMKVGAPGFTAGNRLQIDAALIADGLRLAFDGFRALPFVPMQQFQSVVQLGVTSMEQGFVDSLVTSYFPGTSGDCVLT